MADKKRIKPYSKDVKRKEVVGDKEKDKKTSDRVDTPKNVHPRRSVGR